MIHLKSFRQLLLKETMNMNLLYKVHKELEVVCLNHLIYLRKRKLKDNNSGRLQLEIVVIGSFLIHVFLQPLISPLCTCLIVNIKLRKENTTTKDGGENGIIFRKAFMLRYKRTIRKRPNNKNKMQKKRKLRRNKLN